MKVWLLVPVPANPKVIFPVPGEVESAKLFTVSSPCWAAFGVTANLTGPVKVLAVLVKFNLVAPWPSWESVMPPSPVTAPLVAKVPVLVPMERMLLLLSVIPAVLVMVTEFITVLAVTVMALLFNAPTDEKLIVPPARMTPPVKVLAPLRARLPGPDFFRVNAPAPLPF